jgi:hypothetical protein
VSVVQFISSVSALTPLAGAAGLSGDTHLGSVIVLTWPGLIKWQAAGLCLPSTLARRVA